MSDVFVLTWYPLTKVGKESPIVETVELHELFSCISDMGLLPVICKQIMM